MDTLVRKEERPQGPKPTQGAAGSQAMLRAGDVSREQHTSWLSNTKWLSKRWFEKRLTSQVHIRKS